VGVVNDRPCASHKKKSTEVEETYVNDRVRIGPPPLSAAVKFLER